MYNLKSSHFNIGRTFIFYLDIKMIALIYSDGSIMQDDLKNECQQQKWIPITVKKDKSNNVTVICFECYKVAKSFAKRNFPKNWIKGSITLCDDDLEFFQKKNWKIEILNFPRLLNSHPEYKLDFEIMEFNEKPDLIYTR